MASNTQPRSSLEVFPPIQQLPLLFLWMNTGCNARCGMCSIWRDISGTRLSDQEIDGWMPALRKLRVKEVQLCGEPTTHPKLPSICKSLDDTAIDIHLLTNGLRLGSVVDTVKDSLASVTVSLDGPPGIHDRVRGVKNAYFRLETGIRALRNHLPELPIVGRCVVHRENYRALGATVDTAHDLDLTSISFLSIDASSDAFGRNRVLEDIQKVPGEFLFQLNEIPLLEQELDHLEQSHTADFATGFIVESRATLQSILVSYYLAMVGEGTYRPRTALCNAPWTSVVIEPDGQVSPCFFLPPYGNLRQADSLNGLINALESRRFRAELATSGHPTCSRCVCPRYVETEDQAIGVKLY